MAQDSAEIMHESHLTLTRNGLGGNEIFISSTLIRSTEIRFTYSFYIIEFLSSAWQERPWSFTEVLISSKQGSDWSAETKVKPPVSGPCGPAGAGRSDGIRLIQCPDRGRHYAGRLEWVVEGGSNGILVCERRERARRFFFGMKISFVWRGGLSLCFKDAESRKILRKPYGTLPCLLNLS